MSNDAFDYGQLEYQQEHSEGEEDDDDEDSGSTESPTVDGSDYSERLERQWMNLIKPKEQRLVPYECEKQREEFMLLAKELAGECANYIMDCIFETLSQAEFLDLDRRLNASARFYLTQNSPLDILCDVLGSIRTMGQVEYIVKQGRWNWHKKKGRLLLGPPGSSPLLFLEPPDPALYLPRVVKGVSYRQCIYRKIGWMARPQGQNTVVDPWTMRSLYLLPHEASSIDSSNPIAYKFTFRRAKSGEPVLNDELDRLEGRNDQGKRAREDEGDGGERGGKRLKIDEQQEVHDSKGKSKRKRGDDGDREGKRAKLGQVIESSSGEESGVDVDQEGTEGRELDGRSRKKGVKRAGSLRGELARRKAAYTGSAQGIDGGSQRLGTHRKPSPNIHGDSTTSDIPFGGAVEVPHKKPSDFADEKFTFEMYSVLNPPKTDSSGAVLAKENVIMNLTGDAKGPIMLDYCRWKGIPFEITSEAEPLHCNRDLAIQRHREDFAEQRAERLDAIFSETGLALTHPHYTRVQHPSFSNALTIGFRSIFLEPIDSLKSRCFQLKGDKRKELAIRTRMGGMGERDVLSEYILVDRLAHVKEGRKIEVIPLSSFVQSVPFVTAALDFYTEHMITTRYQMGKAGMKKLEDLGISVDRAKLAEERVTQHDERALQVVKGKKLHYSHDKTFSLNLAAAASEVPLIWSPVAAQRQINRPNAQGYHIVSNFSMRLTEGSVRLLEKQIKVKMIKKGKEPGWDLDEIGEPYAKLWDANKGHWRMMFRGIDGFSLRLNGENFKGTDQERMVWRDIFGKLVAHFKS